MRTYAPSLGAFAAVTLLLGLSTAAHAQDLDAETPTFFVAAGAGYSVYKSQMVQSNDTAFTVNYGFGVYAGASRQVGFLLNRESTTVAFEHNESKIAVDWQDVHLRLRYGAIHAGLMITTSAWKVSAPLDVDGDGLLDQGSDPVDYLDATSTGYGVNFGLRLPVGKYGEMSLEVSQALAGLTRETASDPESAPEGSATPGTRTIAVGPRTEIDLGGSFGFKKWLRGFCGFKQRTYTLTVEGDGFAETHNTTYLGVRAGWVF